MPFFLTLASHEDDLYLDIEEGTQLIIEEGLFSGSVNHRYINALYEHFRYLPINEKSREYYLGLNFAVYKWYLEHVFANEDCKRFLILTIDEFLKLYDRDDQSSYEMLQIKFLLQAENTSVNSVNNDITQAEKILEEIQKRKYGIDLDSFQQAKEDFMCSIVQKRILIADFYIRKLNYFHAFQLLEANERLALKNNFFYLFDQNSYLEILCGKKIGLKKERILGIKKNLFLLFPDSSYMETLIIDGS